MNDRTKALAIPHGVKLQVARRDSVKGWPCCVWCGKPAPTENRLAFSNAHYISRAQGGKGITANILTLCPEDHRRYDATIHRTAMRAYFKAYLLRMHPFWSEDKLYYRKTEEAENESIGCL